MILGGQKSPEKRQVKNDVWLPGHKQDPAERRTSAKIVKSSERRKVRCTSAVPFMQGISLNRDLTKWK